jgi:protein-tyrosine sulfotransferase
MTQERFDGPLFVVGIWRSGTSLFYTLLNQHPDIALLYEGDLPEFWPLFLVRRNKSAWLQRWNCYNRAVERHHLESESIPDGISNISAATDAAYKQYASAKKATLWGCKSPSYYGSLPRLARQFPNARFIIVWRDIQSTCGAIRRAAQTTPWFGRPGIMRRALLGYRKLKRDSEKLRALGFRIHDLHYEELVKDPTTVMSGVCDFLGLSFEPSMASLAGADRSAIYQGAHHSQVRSEKIRPAKQTSDLPPSLNQKIARYLSLWKSESQGTWPVYPRSLDIVAPPSWLEKVTDTMLFHLWRVFDAFTIWVYCFAPLSVLKAYRKVKTAIVFKGVTVSGERQSVQQAGD